MWHLLIAGKWKKIDQWLLAWELTIFMWAFIPMNTVIASFTFLLYNQINKFQTKLVYVSIVGKYEKLDTWFVAWIHKLFMWVLMQKFSPLALFIFLGHMAKKPCYNKKITFVNQVKQDM